MKIKDLICKIQKFNFVNVNERIEKNHHIYILLSIFHVTCHVDLNV